MQRSRLKQLITDLEDLLAEIKSEVYADASAYIDSNGIVLSRIESTRKGVIEIKKYKKINETLFSKFGNKIFFYIIIIYIGVIFFIKRRELK